jgi:hypothetical protein
MKYIFIEKQKVVLFIKLRKNQSEIAASTLRGKKKKKKKQ